jgi:outer membrane autotransporter protein
LSAIGTNGATGVGIMVANPVGGGILNTGTLFGSTSAIDLTQEVGGSTNIVQAGGMMTGNILGGGNDALAVTGGSLVLAPTGVANGLGSFAMGPAGTLALQLTPTQAPLITVNGLALLAGGTVQAQPQAGTYALQTKYTILTASGGVVGKFANVVSTSAFLGPTLSYDANDVFLTLSKSGFLATQATTHNQSSVAGALDASSFNSPLVLAVLNQTVAGARVAFDALSGELHASVQTSLLNDSLFGREALLGRLRQASRAGAPGPVGMLGAGGPQVAQAGTYPQTPSTFAGAPDPMATLGVGGQQLSYADTAGAYAVAAEAPAARAAFPVKAAPAQGPDWTWWAQGVGAWGRIDSDGNAADARDRLAGFFTGVDRRYGDNWRAGLASGYTNSSLNVDARASSANIDTAHFGAYAGTNWGEISFRSGAAVTWSTIGTSRSIVFPGFADSASARYDASTGQVFGEIAEAKAFGNVAVEPFFGLAYVHLHTGGFTEAGGLAALAGSSTNENVGDVSLGLRLATSVALSNGLTLVPRATAYWQHAIGNVTPNAALTFLSTSASFTVAGVPLARDAGVVDAGYDVWLSRQAKVGVSYFGQLAPQLQEHAVKGTFTWLY